MAACGRSFTVAVTEDGELLACGQGNHGQLGLGAVLHQQQPARAGGPELFDNQRIRLAAAGWLHLAVVAEGGAVYTCGWGLQGQLGLGDGQPRRRLTRVPQGVFAGSRVVMVSCGYMHTMAVTAAGHAWTCGDNDYGQLGVGDRTSRLGFTQVDAVQLGGARIVMAACGWNHNVVVSAEGRVWTFGYGLNGCLGHNDEQSIIRLVPTLLAAEVFKGSKIVTVAAGALHTMAAGVNGALWAWGAGYYGRLGLGDTNDRLMPTLVGAEEVFGGSQVRTIACGNDHTLAVTEAGELWAWGQGAQGRLGLNDGQGRLVPTRVDPQHFAHALISAVAAGPDHSAAVTAGGALYTWGKGEAGYTGSQVPGGLGHADLANRLVPTLVPRQLLGGARVGRCHGMLEELALAFAMGTHGRLGAGSAAAGGVGGRRRSRRAQGKAPAARREEEGCPYLMMPADLVKRVVEAGGWRAEGELGEGVVRLMGGRRTSGEI
jgi:alpha-tubulin suppressor-like RCC1 family protein